MQLGSRLDTGKWAYTADEVGERLWDTTKNSLLTFALTNAPAAGHNIHVHMRAKIASDGYAKLYAGIMPSDAELRAMGISESEALGAIVLNEMGKADASKFNIDEIRPQLKTESDTAFFWSGKTNGVGGAEMAADIAKSKSGVTLESTISNKGIIMPKWDFSDPLAMDAWDMASAAYADQASGEVRAIVGADLRPGNIWENIELPRLKRNPNVTKITIIDPSTGLETIIFER